ncbi:ABC transporter substrate-binding protein [Aggregatilinea lenta]|uniref:ABC transporter substrate-binding protein n=1 Tax=Aggregatilinea lenta TaxID=913108 RepID=UPI000E5C1062|nr:CARDB domain-containing protein [Aggregatilinea lenta]
MERQIQKRGRYLFRQWYGLGLAVVVALVAALFAPLALAAPTAQDDAVVRVGYLGEATDEAANGARLTISQINSAGGVTAPDGTSYRLELVMPSPEVLASTALDEAIEELVQQDVVAIFGPNANASFDELTVEKLVDTRLPILTAATENALTSGDLEGQVFRLRAPEEIYSEALAAYMVDQLGLTEIALVQADVESTEPLVNFAAALGQAELEPADQVQIPSGAGLDDAVIDLGDLNPEAIVMWGPPQYAASLLRQMRDGGWTGQFAYRLADEAARGDDLPGEIADGVLGVTSWAYSYTSGASQIFLRDYVSAFGEVPGPLSVALYDGVWLLRAAIVSQGVEPDEILAGLTASAAQSLVQGTLSASAYENGDLIHTAMVYELGPWGGVNVLALYIDGQFVALDEEAPIVETPASPVTTPNPAIGEGAYAVVTTTALNVRSGPGFNFDQIGEVQQGDILEILGAVADYSWLVINYQGGIGWIKAEFANVTGDLGSIPILQSPATPTPAVTAPPALGSQPDLLVESVVLNPAQPVPNQPFAATVTVRNAGGGAAGRFAVGLTFDQANYITGFIEGLASGQSGQVQLSSTVVGTGTAQMIVTADQSNEVAESNETNNSFTQAVQSSAATLAEQTNIQLAAGTQFDLYGGTVDFTWDGYNIAMENGARMGVLGVTYEAASPNDVNDSTINNSVGIGSNQVQPGTVFGVITAEGNKAVARVENRQDQTVWISYKVFQ